MLLAGGVLAIRSLVEGVMRPRVGALPGVHLRDSPCGAVELIASDGLQPGLAARLAVLLGLTEDRGDARDQLRRLLPRDEVGHPAREVGVRGEPSAHAEVEARRAVVADRARERDVVDEPRAKSSRQPVTEILYFRGRSESSGLSRK